MRKIKAYNFITLNGFFKGPEEDFSWHLHEAEESKYSEEMLVQDNILLFGRKTYDQMANFWPSSLAREMFPKVALGMNKSEKIVFSHTPLTEHWENTRLISGDILAEIKKLKQSPGKDMAILGSGSIINLFTEHQLIDEFEIMIDPVVLGEGTPLFNGIKTQLNLELIDVRKFKSGVVLLFYKSTYYDRNNEA